MGDRSPIEWTDATWNPVTGCTKVSQGCKHCYAERVFPRVYGKHMMQDFHSDAGPARAILPPRPRRFTDVVSHPDRLDQPLHWKKPRRVFVNSMSDLFHEDVPDEFLDSVFRVMVRARKHTFQILTKRPERMRAYMGSFKPDGDGWVTRNGVPAMGKIQSSPLIADNNWPPANIWLGTSVEDQETANERIPLLLQTPAAIRFVSYEPALDAVQFTRWLYESTACANCGDASWPAGHCCDDPLIVATPSLHWLIAGGESGPNARPAHPDWFRSARDQCVAAGVAFFFKQWGEWAPDCRCQIVKPHKTTERPSPGRGVMFRCGKKPAGRTLDGREHSEYPA
jgi:protein gp37